MDNFNLLNLIWVIIIPFAVWYLQKIIEKSISKQHFENSNENSKKIAILQLIFLF